MTTLKAIIGPRSRDVLSLDESVCCSWIAFRTNGCELPQGTSTAHIAPLALGGAIAPDQQPTLRAAHALWSARLDEQLRLHAPWGWRHTQNGSAIKDMLDRANVVYEDRRSQKVVSAAYRRGKKIGELVSDDINKPLAFVDKKKGTPIELSKLRDTAMTSLLATLGRVMDECAAAKAALVVELRSSP